MFRIYAAPIAAQVVYVQTFWNRPDAEFIHDAVSRLDYALPIDITVAMRNLGSNPFPASGAKKNL